MEIGSLWMNTWIVPGISVGILICVVMGLIMCLCFKKKNKTSSKMQTFNTNLNTKAFSSEASKDDTENGFFRKLSVLSTSGLKTKLNNNLNYTRRERTVSENDLMDSMDDSNSFEHAVLQVNNTDMDTFCVDMSDESDGTISCLSNESKFTAYSTFTVTRGSSFADTLKSALSYTDIDKL